MAENNETPIKADTKLPKIDCVLTDLQKKIYQYLHRNGAQTAMSIAKAVKKNTASEVKPDLYKMKEVNLLEQNSKVWRIKAVATTGVEGPATNVSMSETELASKTIELTEQQKKIITFLTSNKPSKAARIAKGVGKNVGKDVNRDLYKMKKFKLLCLDEKETLWSINTGLSHTLGGSPNCSLEDSSANQSDIEIDGGKFSYEQDTRRDSGIEVTSPCSDNMRDEPKPTTPPAGCTSLQHGSQMTSAPQYVIKNYSITIHGSHSFTIGDTTWRTQGDTEPIREGNIFIPNYCDTNIAAQGATLNQESGFGHTQEFTDDSLSEPILLHTSEDEGPFSAPHTSSPGPSSYHERILNISEICDGLGNVTVDDQDNNGDMNQLACS